MNTACHNELESEFLKHVNYLDHEKAKRSSEEFKQLIIETWIGFCTQTINLLNKRYNLTENELADVNLKYDRKFETYYQRLHEKEIVMFNS